ncbi:MAG: alpha/beta hydrolase, partial [Syntrophus sp. (in: bacteria)]
DMKIKDLLTPICCSCLFTLVVGCSQENLIFFPEILPPDYKYAFSEPFEELALPVAGATLSAVLFKTAKAKGVILYFHGNAGSLRTWGDVAKDFTSQGYDILISDYRGFGKSTGSISNEKQMLADELAVYGYLKKLYPENRIIVYGRSIGTGVATFVARSGKPGMLIMESPFFSLTDLASYHYPFLPKALISLFLKYPFRTDLWLPEVACPVYLIHGTADDIIPFDASARLELLIKSPHKLIRIEGGGHNNLSDYSAYDRELALILDGYQPQ